MNQSETYLILLVSHEEWAARSFESILKPHGYVALKAYTGRQCLELMARIRPDIVMVEHRLPDMLSEELFERMQQLSTIRPSTPTLVFTTDAMDRRDRLEQLKAGAWEVLNPPFDPEEILARVQRFVAAKRDTDRALEESHVDPQTGFYNLVGLKRRMTELAADATRSGRPLGCVAVGPGGEPVPAMEDMIRALARVMTETTRLTDAIGRVGENAFVVVAPGLDQEGAERLAERLMEALDVSAEVEDVLKSARPVAGIYAVRGGEGGGPLVADDFLEHATTALSEALTQGNGLRIRSFKPE